jgi:integral membrane protein
MADQTRTWFFWLGRFETASFVALLGIAMPLKYAAGLPAAVGWVGWTHGVLLIVYLLALLSVARVFKVGLVQVAVAGVLALLPFGPVLLEHRWRKAGLLDLEFARALDEFDAS